jgi:hypothetical protein
MLEILKFMCSGFWVFIGSSIIILTLSGLIANLLFRIINRFFRMLNIRKHGWPPTHVDADGDFKIEPKSADA